MMMFSFFYSSLMNVQMTLEQNGFEWHGSTYMWIFFNQRIGKNFGDFQQFKERDFQQFKN